MTNFKTLAPEIGDNQAQMILRELLAEWPSPVGHTYTCPRSRDEVCNCGAAEFNHCLDQTKSVLIRFFDGRISEAKPQEQVSGNQADNSEEGANHD